MNGLVITIEAQAVDVAFNTAISYAQASQFMPPQTVSAPLAFSVNPTGARKNGGVYVRLTADGVNTPTFAGMSELGGMGYDPTAGVVNCVTFWYDGTSYWFSVMQAVS